LEYADELCTKFIPIEQREAEMGRIFELIMNSLDRIPFQKLIKFASNRKHKTKLLDFESACGFEMFFHLFTPVKDF
jgi:hypothetical protein